MLVNRRRILSLSAFFALAFVCSRADAGLGIITVNQHPTYLDGDCTYCPLGSTLCPSCPVWDPNCAAGCANDPGGACRYNEPTDYSNGSETLPYTAIANPTTGANVDVFSYHVNPWGTAPNLRRWRGRICQALAEYQFSGRPKILSTDMPNVNSNGSEDDLRFYLGLVCSDAAIPARRGRVHLEHFDPYLDGQSQTGSCIDQWSDFPDDSRDALNVIANASCGQDHHPNGTLTRSTDKLRFSEPRGAASPPKTILKGYGFMGALSAGERLDPEAYFRILGWKGVNLTRVWDVEQWSGQVDRDDLCPTAQTEGPTPFEGTRASDYNLAMPNPTFYSRLRQFAQEAADRGIVVQLSLYDIHGILNFPFDTCWKGRFEFSPYNWENNTTSTHYMVSDPSYCTCSQDLGDEYEPPQDLMDRSAPCEGPRAFVEHPDLQANHLDYVRRVAEEVGGMGNVMFEIINEALVNLDWTSTTPTGEAWQLTQAENLRMALPIQVARDAFNDEWTSGASRTLALAGRKPDARVSDTDLWTSDNVQVVQQHDVDPQNPNISTDSWLGHATSAGQQGASVMQASLPLSGASAPWTKLQVRADLELYVPGTFDLGVQGPTWQDAVLLRISTEHESPLYYATLIMRRNGSETTIGSFTLSGTHHTYRIRLRMPSFEKPAPPLRADVFMDGSAVIEDAAAGYVSDYARAFFRGWVDGQSTYPPDRAKVDNFEAARFCDDELRGCTP